MRRFRCVLTQVAVILLATQGAVWGADSAADVDSLSPDVQSALAQGQAAADAAISDLEIQAQAPLASYSDAPTPAEQAIDSLGRLQSEIRKGAKRHQTGFLEATPEAITLCVPTPLSLCLNGRFIVTGAWDSPYDGSGAFPTFAIQLTPQSGILYFQDPTNFEVVVKVLNSNCFASPPRPWVFAAGLTNFGVAINVRDQLSGAEVLYVNPLSNVFPPIQDQSTPFACY